MSKSPVKKKKKKKRAAPANCGLQENQQLRKRTLCALLTGLVRFWAFGLGVLAASASSVARTSGIHHNDQQSLLSKLSPEPDCMYHLHILLSIYLLHLLLKYELFLNVCYIYLWMFCLHVRLCPHMHVWYPQWLEGGTGSLGTCIMNGYEPSHGNWTWVLCRGHTGF